MKLNRNEQLSMSRRAAIGIGGAALALSAASAARAAPAAKNSTDTGGGFSVKSFGAQGNANDSGAGADDTAAIQAALDYVGGLGGGTLYFPQGTYKLSAPLAVPANVVLRGAGRMASKLLGTHSGGGGSSAAQSACAGSILYSVQPINTSTRVDLTIEDLWLASANPSNVGAGFYGQSAVVLSIRNCEIGNGCKWGIILDQCEDVLIEGSEIGASVDGGAAIWILNGADLNPSASGGFSNIITVRDCMINVAATCYGVVDDGGYAHLFEGCNFVCGINGLRACDVDGLTLVGNYFEAQISDSILLSSVTLSGNSLGGSFTSIAGVYVNAGAHAAIRGTASPGMLTVTGGCFVNGAGAHPISGASNFYQLQLYGVGNATHVATTDAIPTDGHYFDSSQLSMDASGNLKAAGMTATSGGVGYAAGAGGTVIQAGSKSTGVDLDRLSGQITMNPAALPPSTTVSFTLKNMQIGSADVLILNHVSGGTPGAYQLNAHGTAAGSRVLDVRNLTADPLSESIVIGFAVIKAVIT